MTGTSEFVSALCDRVKIGQSPQNHDSTKESRPYKKIVDGTFSVDDWSIWESIIGYLKASGVSFPGSPVTIGFPARWIKSHSRFLKIALGPYLGRLTFIWECQRLKAHIRHTRQHPSCPLIPYFSLFSLFWCSFPPHFVSRQSSFTAKDNRGPKAPLFSIIFSNSWSVHLRCDLLACAYYHAVQWWIAR
jgi:hypothetical protein